LKAKYDGAYYLDWPEEVVQRRPQALANARRELADEIDQVCFAQFLLFRPGETPFTTGMHFERAVIGGRLLKGPAWLLTGNLDDPQPSLVRAMIR
jgi:hypothetical protein